MTENQLREDLVRLREEITKLATEGHARERLEEIVDRIEGQLEAEGSLEETPPLVETVKDAIEQFETEHPRATAILNDIMVALSSMGI